ncbi:MAG: alpha/beta fold hydrolase, partial [Verrucomicrobiota bacterium]|nr:alpha/beta fold hydrolase [Verrucomicrobiota bacterium]
MANFARALFVLACVCIGLAAKAAEPDAVGHWEGAIKLPGTELGVRVDLDRDATGAWTGTIDIPAQGLRGFKLGEVAVKGADVSLGMPGIPGEPKLAGQLAADAQSISGHLTQAGQTFPFKLARKPRPTMATGATPSKGVPGKGLVGHWLGALRPAPVSEMRLVLKVSSLTGGRLSGVLLSVDQGNSRFPITTLSEKDGAVRVELPQVGGHFEGRLSEDGSEITGEWKQLGQSLPLVFRRLAEAPDFRRPQDPQKPFPYLEELVTFQSAGDITLAGTLTFPRSEGPHPAVVLVSGSGPQDRDEALMGHRPFLVLADHLTREGIAVLRYDDRGVAKSKGDFSRATHEDFTDDALAAVSFLRGRKECDPGRLGIIGHSEGGIVAPLAAVRSSDVAFIVLLAGVGVPMEELLVRQGEDISRTLGLDAESIAANTRLQREIFRLLREGKDDEALDKK